MFRPSSARLCAASPFPRCACPPPISPRRTRVLRLRCLAEPPLRNLFSSKSYTRAGLQGIVNCSCSANLHKSILNQLSGLRRVRARRLAAWKRTGYAQVPDATQRDPTPTPMPTSRPRPRTVSTYQRLHTGCLERHALRSVDMRERETVPTHRVRVRVRVCTLTEQSTTPRLYRVDAATRRAKKFRGVTTACIA